MTNKTQEAKIGCGCLCHYPNHRENGLIHDRLCCDKLNGSLEMQAVRTLIDKAMSVVTQVNYKLLAQARVEGAIEELEHVDRHTTYYPDGSEPIEAQTRLAHLKSKGKNEL